MLWIAGSHQKLGQLLPGHWQCCVWVGEKKKGPVNIKEAGTSDPRASSDLASLHFIGQITKAQEIIYLLH